MKIKIIIGLAISLMLATSVFAADMTVAIVGNTTAVENTPYGWMFNRDTGTSTPYSFTTAAAKIGNGSLFVAPIGANASDKFIAENFVRTDMGDVNGISFDFLMGAGADPNQYYMNVYANFGVSSETKFYDCRYNVVASMGSDMTWTTLSFDPDSVYPVTQSGSSPSTCPANPSGMGADAHIRVVAINLGDTSASDAGYSGYFDKVVVDRASGKTTYDFEPYLVATNANQCKNGGWQTYRRANGSTFKNQGDCIQYVNNGH